MFRFMMGRKPRHVFALAASWILLCLLGGVVFALPARATGEDPRDFPPLVDPNRPGVRAPAPSPPSVPVVPPPAPGTAAAQTGPEEEAYRLGVGDEVQVSVLNSPELSGIVRVRPDGAISSPGVGTVHALGRTPEDVGHEMQEKLAAILRYPRVDLIVTNFGPQRVFVMGEVEAAGDKPYYKGMTALQALAAAGGISLTGKAGSVLVLRRTGSDAAEVRRLDLSQSLKGESDHDIVLYPFDIVFVPKTFIARVDVAIDQYIRQTMAPFTTYLEGWKAINVGTGRVSVVTTP